MHQSTFYGDFKCRVSTENLFDISKQAEVEICRLVDLVTELGFPFKKNLAESECALNVPLKFGRLQNLWGIWRVDFLPLTDKNNHERGKREYMSYITNDIYTSSDTLSQYLTENI